MAENKNSFIIYTDWKIDFEFLTDEEAGKLIKHLLRFASDENPSLENEDRLLQFAAQKMKAVMKKDLKKYEAVIQKRAEAGKKGGVNSGKSRTSKQNEANEANASTPKQNEHDNVNDNVNDNVILLKKETKYDDDGENFSNDENFEKKQEAKNFLKNSKPQFSERIRMHHKISKEHYNEKVDEFVEKKFDWGENDWKDLDDMAKNFEFWMPSNYRRTVNPYKTWSENDFKEDCRKHLKKFGKDMVNTFFNHFRQVTPDGEMLFQTKAAWNTEAQLKNWYNKEISKKKYAN